MIEVAIVALFLGVIGAWVQQVRQILKLYADLRSLQRQADMHDRRLIRLEDDALFARFGSVRGRPDRPSQTHEAQP